MIVGRSSEIAQTSTTCFKRALRVCYPPGTGTLVIRTELDWERDIHPIAVSSDGNTATFEVEARQSFVHFKPCLIKNGTLHWAVGTNNLLIMAADDARVVYPYFFGNPRGRFSPLVEIESAIAAIEAARAELVRAKSAVVSAEATT
jgi:hypothetical protein